MTSMDIINERATSVQRETLFASALALFERLETSDRAEDQEELEVINTLLDAHMEGLLHSSSLTARND